MYYETLSDTMGYRCSENENCKLWNFILLKYMYVYNHQIKYFTLFRNVDNTLNTQIKNLRMKATKILSKLERILEIKVRLSIYFSNTFFEALYSILHVP